MSNDDNWSRYSKLVMANLEDHEERIKKLEDLVMGMRLDMVRYSFYGSIGGSIVTLLPLALTWYFTH